MPLRFTEARQQRQRRRQQERKMTSVTSESSAEDKQRGCNGMIGKAELSPRSEITYWTRVRTWCKKLGILYPLHSSCPLGFSLRYPPSRTPILSLSLIQAFFFFFVLTNPPSLLPPNPTSPLDTAMDDTSPHIFFFLRSDTLSHLLNVWIRHLER